MQAQRCERDNHKKGIPLDTLIKWDFFPMLLKKRPGAYGGRGEGVVFLLCGRGGACPARDSAATRNQTWKPQTGLPPQKKAFADKNATKCVA